MVWIFLFLVTLFIRPQDWPGSPVYAWPLNDVIVGGGFLTGLLSVFFQRKQISNPHNYLLLLFMCLAFSSNLLNGNSDFNIIAKRVMVYFMFIFLVDTPKRIRQVLFISLLLVLVLVFQGMYQKNTGVGWAMQHLHTFSDQVEQSTMLDFDKFGVRTFWIGLWDGPNVLAVAYLFVVPFCLGSIFKVNRKTLSSVIYSIFFLLLGYGLYLTNSRGGTLAFLCIVFLFILERFGLKKTLLITLLILPLVAVVLPKRMTVLNSSESSAHERTWLWEQGLNMLRSKPLSGIGKGRFGAATGLIAHSNYAGNMAEMGLPGLIVYLALMYYPAKVCYFIFKKTAVIGAESELRSLSRMLLFTLAGFAVATMFVIMEHDILYILWALCVGLYLIAKKTISGFNLSFCRRDWFTVGSMGIMYIMFVWLVAVKEIF